MRHEAFCPRSWNNRDWRTGEVRYDQIFGPSAEEKYGAPYLLAQRGDLHAALDGLVRIVKRKLKKIQYRPHLIDGCLAATGLKLEPW